jgi:hypothetical protein
MTRSARAQQERNQLGVRERDSAAQEQALAWSLAIW